MDVRPSGRGGSNPAAPANYFLSCKLVLSIALPLGPSALIARSVLILRRVLASLLLLIATVALSAPAAASIVHGVDHIPAPVSAGEHHHHADSGDVDVHEEGVPDPSDQSGSNGIAHSHPPFLGAEPAMLGSALMPLPLLAAQVQKEWTVRELKTLSWSPHKRPPRTA